MNISDRKPWQLSELDWSHRNCFSHCMCSSSTWVQSVTHYTKTGYAPLFKYHRASAFIRVSIQFDTNWRVPRNRPPFPSLAVECWILLPLPLGSQGFVVVVVGPTTSACGQLNRSWEYSAQWSSICCLLWMSSAVLVYAVSLTNVRHLPVPHEGLSSCCFHFFSYLNPSVFTVIPEAFCQLTLLMSSHFVQLLTLIELAFLLITLRDSCEIQWLWCMLDLEPQMKPAVKCLIWFQRSSLLLFADVLSWLDSS